MTTKKLAAAAAPQDSAWTRHLLAWALLCVAILIVYGRTAVGMVEIWYRSETFTHAFLVPVISAWLVWRDRDRLHGIVPAVSPPWAVALAAAALTWFVARAAGVNAGMHFALVSMLVVSVPLMLGWRVTRELLFPLLFLYFCVPIGEFLLPVLIDRTADFTVAALRFTGVPVVREGNQFSIPSGNWSVVEACSGLRYLIASMMVGMLFAYLNYRSTRRRLMFVAVAIAVPIVANWVRAYLIVMLGHLSNNKIATGVDHLVYGWVFFGVVIMLMFWIGGRWAEPDAPRRVADDSAARPVAGRTDAAIKLAGTAAAALAIVGAPPMAMAALTQAVSDAPVQLPWPVNGAEGWSLVDTPAPLHPHVVGARVERTATYVRAGERVHVYVGYFRGQGEQRKLASSVHQLIDGNDGNWAMVDSSREDCCAGDSWRGVQLLRRVGDVARQPVSVWQGYWIDGSVAGSGFRAKLLGLEQFMQRRGDDGAYVVLLTDGAADKGGRETLQAFTRTQWPAISVALASEAKGAR